MILAPVVANSSYGEDLVVYTNRAVFSPGEPLFVYGIALENAPVIVRLGSPNDNIIHFEQLITKNDGINYYGNKIKKNN